MRSSIAILALILAACSAGKTPAPGAAPAPHGKLTLHGPFIHEHLALFIVEDPAAKSVGEFITLEEGMKSGAVKVTEKKTAEVSELLVENASDTPCFVQAGDVVKGGQQDRAIASDFVIPAKSGAKPLASFCVEQGRWSGSSAFTGITLNATNSVKRAVQSDKSQGKVWEEVRKYKSENSMNNNLGPSSSTSVNEELEHVKIKERREAFLQALGKIAEGRPHAVGLVSAVNGEFSTADVYGDPGLFRKLFPRLLDSAALEAIAAAKKDAKPPTAGDAAAFLAQSAEGQSREEKTGEGLEAVRTENDKTLRFKYLYNKGELHCQSLKR